MQKFVGLNHLCPCIMTNSVQNAIKILRADSKNKRYMTLHTKFD